MSKRKPEPRRKPVDPAPPPPPPKPIPATDTSDLGVDLSGFTPAKPGPRVTRALDDIQATDNETRKAGPDEGYGS